MDAVAQVNVYLVILSGDYAIVVMALPYRHWDHLFLRRDLKYSSAHGHLLGFG